MEIPEVLTAKEVAKLLKVSVRTVHAWRRKGKLRAIQLGGTGPYRFYADNLARFLGVATSHEPSDEELKRRCEEILQRRGIKRR